MSLFNNLKNKEEKDRQKTYSVPFYVDRHTPRLIIVILLCIFFYVRQRFTDCFVQELFKRV